MSKTPGEGLLPTLKDIAQQAGVSIKTVSRVINNEPHIRDEKRERVLRIVKKLKYVPNTAARSLKMGRTDTIAVTTGGANMTRVFNHAYMGQVYAGLAQGLDATDYKLLFCHFKQLVTTEDAEELAGSRFMDGIIYILLSVYRDEFLASGIVDTYRKRGVPFVVIHSMKDDLGCNAVTMDGVAGGAAVGRHFAGHGYRTAGIVTAGNGVPHMEDMYNGYCNALDDAGMSPRPEHVYKVTAIDAVKADEPVRRIIAQGQARPRALFVSLSGYTPVLINGLRKAGIRVPEDMAVIGFDEPQAGQFYEPQLTYLVQPGAAKGKAAVELLLARIGQGNGTGTPETVVIEPELKVGRSCGCG